MLLLCVIFRILEVIDRFITSQFRRRCNQGHSIAQAYIRKLCGRGVTETTALSSITLAFYKIQDSNFFYW